MVVRLLQPHRRCSISSIDLFLSTISRSNRIYRDTRLGRRLFQSSEEKQKPTSTTSTTKNNTTVVITTDEGIKIHTSDPSTTSTTTAGGLGLVWGSVLWPSGIALSKYLHYLYNNNNNANNSCDEGDEKENEIVQARTVLELGCGTGVVGLTCAKYSQNLTQLTLTDSETALWPLLRKSINDNQLILESSAAAQEQDSTTQKIINIHGLDWRDPTTFLAPTTNTTTTTSAGCYDLIVAADVLYSGMDKLFARALASHLYNNNNNNNRTGKEDRSNNKNNRNVALVASPFRKDSPLLGFLQTITSSEKFGLQVERLENSMGEAVGAYTGTNAHVAYQDCCFVPIVDVDNNNNNKLEEISTSPIFSKHNEKQIQIFRIIRISGKPQDAANIRRISRI